MSDKQIKMADVFVLPADHVDMDAMVEFSLQDKQVAAIYAINSHDRLTAANEALREEVKRLRDQIDAECIVSDSYRQERDQLKAQVMEMREALITCHNAHPDFHVESPDVCRTIENTPKAILAAHDAEVIDRVKASWSSSLNEDEMYSGFEILDALDHEISKLIHQTKEPSHNA